MKILYGTTNYGKSQAMKGNLEGLPLEITDLKELALPIPRVEESGKNPLENAVIKAEAYYKAFKMPVFSCDSGLYFDGVDESLQPGTHIRRVDGKELSDEEMIEYYSTLSAKHGGRLIARYKNAICLIIDENTRFSLMDETLASKPFIITSVAHRKRVEGFPIDSISQDMDGIYYYDVDGRSVAVDGLYAKDGFRAFFERALTSLKE